MLATSLTCSSPTLPIPRQPSPLSLSTLPPAEDDMRVTPEPINLPPGYSNINPMPAYDVVVRSTMPCASSTAPDAKSITPRLPTSGHLLNPLEGTSLPPIQPHGSSQSTSSPKVPQIPITPQPDSPVLRTSLSDLEKQASTLKRLSKSVLASTAGYLSLLEHLEKTEDELFTSLGELGGWLETGFGIPGGIWDEQGGIRKVRRDRRKKEYDEVEGLVRRGLEAVKGDMKRKGVAGGGAQARYEQSVKQYYHQTSVFLSPQSSQQGTGFSPGHPVAHSHSFGDQLDLAQAARLAEFESQTYQHHSTLLWAVPPSSIICLDILANLYSWVSRLLGEVPGRPPSDDVSAGHPRRVASDSSDGAGPTSLNGSAVQTLRPPIIGKITTEALKDILAIALGKLSEHRASLVDGWDSRDQQSTLLRDEATAKNAKSEGPAVFSKDKAHQGISPAGGPAPISIPSAGIEYKKVKKMQKIPRAVGGRLKGLLSSSGSSANLARNAERSSRGDVDDAAHRQAPSALPLSESPVMKPVVFDGPPGAAPHPSNTPLQSPASAPLPNPPSPRPVFPSRHSIQAPPAGYISPFNPIPFDSTPDLRSLVLANSPSAVAVGGNVGGVGGLSGGGDEDLKREEAGRKKEGMLWGAGIWEGLSKGGNRGKFEKYWVVLDRSRIYEYRDKELPRPETAHVVIDLKFASVREGRGTDRRFTFEVVTPTQGRRLYQATSESEMRLWLYAICNAIESCINGTSSVRTFDASKLRTVSGSLDDHAVPSRSRLFPPFNGRNVGLGLPMPTIPGSPGNRRSMPPIPSHEVEDGGGLWKRQRKTSFKHAPKQSLPIVGDKWDKVIGGPKSTIDIPPFAVTQPPERAPSQSSMTSTENRPITDSSCLPKGIDTSPASGRTDRTSWYSTDDNGDIEKKVFEMAGLGLGSSPGSSPSESRRRQSEGLKTLSTRQEMARSKSAADVSPPPRAPLKIDMRPVDMSLLREIAELPSNTRCADCGKGMRSSRWSIIRVRELPMVMFLCIRCCGVHRSLGTHISKPRSVDMDTWTPETIRLAQAWGNERGNAMWERTKPALLLPTDEGIIDFIRAKYVEGKWLAAEDRDLVGLGG